ncbi:hypothetical protein AAC387_Pa05g3580 [Persea americana]
MSKESSLYNISGFRLLSPILGILAYDATNHSELDIFVDKDPSLSTSPTSPKPHLLMGSDHCVWHWCRERRRQRRMRDYGEWREQVQNEGLGRESEWNGGNNCKMRD